MWSSLVFKLGDGKDLWACCCCRFSWLRLQGEKDYKVHNLFMEWLNSLAQVVSLTLGLSDRFCSLWQNNLSQSFLGVQLYCLCKALAEALKCIQKNSVCTFTESNDSQGFQATSMDCEGLYLTLYADTESVKQNGYTSWTFLPFLQRQIYDFKLASI